MTFDEKLERILNSLLFLGLTLALIFVYFAQQRLFNRINEDDLSLGPERFIRILAVICIFFSVIIVLFKAKKHYQFSIYFAYLSLLFYITFNYFFSGASFSSTTELMSTKGIGPWICLGLIFVSYDTKRYEKFKKFLLYAVAFIAFCSILGMIQSGVGLWRGRALSQYQVYAVNLVWIAPYVFLFLKNNKKLKWFRIFAISIGIILALVIQTRSFLIIYFLALAFDFFNTKNKIVYVVLMAIGLLGFTYLVFNTQVLNDSFESLLDRGVNDTRSGQLVAFISQLDFFELISGNGFYSSYSTGRSISYYVDNQWLYLLWWGGLIPVLCYFYLSAVIPVKLILRGSLDYETKVECFILILWVLALAGLAIFTTMSVDFFFYIISILLGRVLYKYSSFKN